MQVGPVADFPCFTPPTPKSYCIATTQEHISSKRSGKERRCKLVCEVSNAERHRQSENLRLISFSAVACTHTARHQKRVGGGQAVPRPKIYDWGGGGLRLPCIAPGQRGSEEC